MLCNVTGTMTMIDGSNATGRVFTMIPSVGGVVRIGPDNVAMVAGHFRVGQGGTVNFIAQSGEYVLRDYKGNDTVVYIPHASEADISEILPLPIYRKGSRVVLRQGDTLQIGAVYCTEYNVPQDLTDIDVTANMRLGGGIPVALDIDVTNEERGEFTMTLDAEDTEDLPVGLYDAQVVFTRNDIVKSAINIEINVVEGF